MKVYKFLMVVVLLAFLAGCASLWSDFEQPEVKLVSFKPLPAEGLEQRFEIGLRIVNHDRRQLDINGISYYFSLNDYKVFSGVSNNVPEIPAYSDSLVTLEGSANIISGGRFILDMLQGSRDQVAYELQTRIDVGTFIPAIKIIETGSLDDLP